MVTFVPSKGSSVNCVINPDDGSYTLPKVPTGKARIVIAPPGKKHVDPKAKAMADAIKAGRMPKPSPEELEKMPQEFKEVLDGSFSTGVAVSLPPRYTDQTKSELEYEVTSGSQTHNIELK
jgi:hypothetical protein